jgi:hypothetical protein
MSEPTKPTVDAYVEYGGQIISEDLAGAEDQMAKDFREELQRHALQSFPWERLLVEHADDENTIRECCGDGQRIWCGALVYLRTSDFRSLADYVLIRWLHWRKHDVS